MAVSLFNLLIRKHLLAGRVLLAWLAGDSKPVAAVSNGRIWRPACPQGHDSPSGGALNF